VKFSAADYLAEVSHYEKDLRLLDDTLYRLCREHPNHTTPSSVHAKLWIIGRTYATGIERKIETRKKKRSPLSKVAELFLANGEQLDELIAELNTIAEPLSPEKLQTVTRVHGRILKILARITRDGQSPRSFVSKYLHFHNSLVPIYDSRAAGVLRAFKPRTIDEFQIPAGGDTKYAEFTMRFLKLYEFVRAADLKVNVKYLDNYLLSISGKLFEIAMATDQIG
jgi:hypothetical protein